MSAGYNSSSVKQISINRENNLKAASNRMPSLYDNGTRESFVQTPLTSPRGYWTNGDVIKLSLAPNFQFLDWAHSYLEVEFGYDTDEPTSDDITDAQTVRTILTAKTNNDDATKYINMSYGKGKRTMFKPIHGGASFFKRLTILSNGVSLMNDERYDITKYVTGTLARREHQSEELTGWDDPYTIMTDINENGDYLGVDRNHRVIIPLSSIFDGMPFIPVGNLADPIDFEFQINDVERMFGISINQQEMTDILDPLYKLMTNETLVGTKQDFGYDNSVILSPRGRNKTNVTATDKIIKGSTTIDFRIKKLKFHGEGIRLVNASEFDTRDVTIHTLSTETMMLNIGSATTRLEPQISMNIGSLKYIAMVTLSSKAFTSLCPDDGSIYLGKILPGADTKAFSFYPSKYITADSYIRSYEACNFYQLPMKQYNYSYSGEILPSNYTPTSINSYYNIIMEFHGAGIGGYGDNPFIKYNQAPLRPPNKSVMKSVHIAATAGNRYIGRSVLDMDNSVKNPTTMSKRRDSNIIGADNEVFYIESGNTTEMKYTSRGEKTKETIKYTGDNNRGSNFILFHCFSALVSDGKQFIDGINTSGKTLKLQIELNAAITPTDFNMYAVGYSDMITQISGRDGRINTWGGQN